jgi:cytochrome b561
MQYGRVAQLFHWLSMLLIVGLAIGGTIMTRIDSTAQQSQMYQDARHRRAGGAAADGGSRRNLDFYPTNVRTPPAEMKAAQKTAFAVNHLLLYLVIILMVVSGVSMLLLSGVGLSPLV